MTVKRLQVPVEDVSIVGKVGHFLLMPKDESTSFTFVAINIRVEARGAWYKRIKLGDISTSDYMRR